MYATNLYMNIFSSDTLSQIRLAYVLFYRTGLLRTTKKNVMREAPPFFILNGKVGGYITQRSYHFFSFTQSGNVGWSLWRANKKNPHTHTHTTIFLLLMANECNNKIFLFHSIRSEARARKPFPKYLMPSSVK